MNGYRYYKQLVISHYCYIKRSQNPRAIPEPMVNYAQLENTHQTFNGILVRTGPNPTDLYIYHMCSVTE